MSTELEQSKPRGAPARLPMDSLEAARRTLARIVRAFYNGQLDESTYRGTVYGFGTLLQFFRLKYDEEEIRTMNARLDELEKLAAGKGGK